MTGKRNLRRASWQIRVLLLLASICVFASGALGQGVRPSPTPPIDATTPTPAREKDDDVNFGSPESEMRSKLIIKEEKKRYDENVARAKEAADLASQIRDSFVSNKRFASADGKKLERLEKLTKRIRNEAGGSEDYADADIKDIPATMPETLKCLADMTDELQKMVEKTPRNVISAAVIDHANKVIGLVQHVRSSR